MEWVYKMLGICRHEYEADTEFINGARWRFCKKCGHRQASWQIGNGDWQDF